jgi:hypothetical protein
MKNENETASRLTETIQIVPNCVMQAAQSVHLIAPSTNEMGGGPDKLSC